MDEHKRLTQLGRSMARLPIAPTVARMVLQAQKEQALKEVLVIASAISIQDPRVRPLGQEKAADQEHKRFVDKTSDFLSLLNIWNAYHGTMEHLKTQSQMRKFCAQHFLSFNRMREWRDIYTQIRHTLREIGGFRFNKDDADYNSIHRSIVSGLLSNVAQKKEGNIYRAARGREVMLFPGSGLFLRRKEEEKEKLEQAKGKEASTPSWVIAGEVVETSRLFARTVAQVQPQWLVELGAHLCQATYKEPFYSVRSGRVLATQTLTLHGLQIQKKRVGYGKIDPKAATEVFIREALVNDEVILPHEFLTHNRELRERVETWQMRQRHTQFLDLDEAVYRFYAERLEGVSSTHDLNRVVRDQGADYLMMTEADLSGGDDVDFDRGSFPEYLEVDGQQIPLVYAYRPGQDEDGVTLKLPYKMMHFVQGDVLEWLVPGLLEEKITYLLRSLPKGIRKQFVPVPDKARDIARSLQPTHGDFLASLSAHILSRYGIETSVSDWKTDDLPEHLRMRVEVQGEKEETIASARDLAILRERLEQHEESVESDAWTDAVKLVSRQDVVGRDLGALPERVEVSQMGGMTVFGYVGLKREGDRVDVCLFKRPDEAEKETRLGWIRLCEREMREEMKALKRALGELKQATQVALFEGGSEALREAAYENLVAFLFDKDAPLPVTTERFEARVKEARVRLQHMVPQLLGSMTTLFETYREICLMPKAYPELEADVSRLMPPDFLRRTPFDQLPHLSRFLKAIQLRAERAKVDVRKDFQKAEQVKPFQDAVDVLLDSELSFEKRTAAEDLRWLLEEFRVSVFAQELGTAQKVSPKRLSDQLEKVRGMK